MFGDKLKKIRIDNGFTQEELADRLFVTRTAVSKWETNKGYPSIDSLKQMSMLFGVSIDELISEEDIKNTEDIIDKRKKKLYWYSVVCFAAAVSSLLILSLAKVEAMLFVSVVSAAGYIIFALMSANTGSKKNKKKPNAISRIVITAVFLFAIIPMLLSYGG